MALVEEEAEVAVAVAVGAVLELYDTRPHDSHLLAARETSGSGDHPSRRH